MPDQKIDIDELIIKHLQGSITEAERQYLDRWITASEANRLLFEKLTDPGYVNAELEKLDRYDDEKGWKAAQASLNNLFDGFKSGSCC